MNLFRYFLLVLVLATVLVGCTDNLLSVGLGLQPSSDNISTNVDTVYITSSSDTVPHAILSNKSDTLLLGYYNDSIYGGTRAEILAQVVYPLGYVAPPGAKIDSAEVMFRCVKHSGDVYGPLSINVYKMGTQLDSYSKSDVDPSKYAATSILLGSKVITFGDASKSKSDTTLFKIKLKIDSINIFQNSSQIFANQQSFNEFFKGVYINTNYGSGGMMNITGLGIQFYSSLAPPYGNNTPFPIFLPCNKLDARQVNRFVNTAAINKSGYNHIASPAKSYTNIRIPMARIRDRILDKSNKARTLLNRAVLDLEIVNYPTLVSQQSAPKYLMLIRKDRLNEFFANNSTFTRRDTLFAMATIGSFNTDSLIYTTNHYLPKYVYRFDLARLIQQNLNWKTDNLDLVAVPVIPDHFPNPYSILEDYKMSGVTIRSAVKLNGSGSKNYTDPSGMKIQLMYSKL